MRYLHERFPVVIHRDIKPSNILLGDRTGNSAGPAYLVDFGSVQAAPVGGTITVVGTYGYMPPEQFGDRAVPASDLYSLGATLIYLATGQHPAGLPHLDMRLHFEDVAHLSVGLEQWLQQMIQPSLNQRLSSAKKALSALQERTSNLEVLVRQPVQNKLLLIKTASSLEIVLPPTASSSSGGKEELISMGLFEVAPKNWTGS